MQRTYLADALLGDFNISSGISYSRLTLGFVEH
jgi:hypothetical protein